MQGRGRPRPLRPVGGNHLAPRHRQGGIRDLDLRAGGWEPGEGALRGERNRVERGQAFMPGGAGSGSGSAGRAGVQYYSPE
eukprot:1177597-Prorocentrum_minimum.AAC.10